MKKRLISLILVLVMSLHCVTPAFANEIEPDTVSDNEFITTSSYVPPSVASVIGGTDDRETVSTRQQFPYSAIGDLYITYTDGCTAKGTGYMVSKNCMLTAAHCLICTEHGKAAASVRARFGYNTSQNYVATETATPSTHTMYYCPNYTITNTNAAYDYGYIIFNNNLGDTTGWFGMAARTNSVLQNKSVTVCGYENSALKKATGTIGSVLTTNLYYSIDTKPGQSGSPVYWYDSSYGYLSSGIHIEGTTNDDNGYNVAWRITSTFINTLVNAGYAEKV